MADFKDLPHHKYDHEKPEYRIDPMEPLIEEIVTDFRRQHDDNIMKAVADVGIVVDKPRLIQALTDAKAFYEEGYRAAMTKADLVGVVRCKDCKYWGGVTFGYICRRFSGTTLRNETRETDYCSFGAKMDGVPDTNVGKMDGKGEGE